MSDDTFFLFTEASAACLIEKTNSTIICIAGKTIYADYITEYSTDRIEMHIEAVQPGQRVVLIDDLVATGGTLRTFFFFFYDMI